MKLQTRYILAQHRAGKDQLVLAKTYQEQHARDWRQEVRIPEEDQPSSLEAQLLFHRAGVYLTLACNYVHAALDGLQEAEEKKAEREAKIAAGEEVEPETLEEVSARFFRIESRKQVRQNAKRALRDYTAFLSHFEYTPGLSPEIAEQFLLRLGSSANHHPSTNGYSKDNIRPHMSRLLESNNATSSASDALVPHRRPHGHNNSHDRDSWPKLPPPTIYKASQLFDAAPLSSLPPYPAQTPPSPASAAAAAFADTHESITYHPLLTDALHSLLLCHALIQTPAKEHLRHAHNAARLARICDGYPIFLAARSPARADWIEVVRRAGNWIGLTSSWENLCRPAPLPGHYANSSRNSGSSTDLARTGANGTSSIASTSTAETETQKRERQKQEAILDALADERVVDEASFQRAVRARERRFRQDEEDDNNSMSPASPTSPTYAASKDKSATSSSVGDAKPKSKPFQAKRWAQDDSTREYPISTERAEAISRWVREAPAVEKSESGGKKRRAKGKGKKSVSGLKREGTTGSLADSVASMSLVEDDGDVAEEVDE
jgi:hypothetical protein